MVPRILIVEDNVDIARLVKFHLAELPATVVVATDGIAGLAAAEGQAFDAVILDVNLPGLNGQEILRRLRALGNRVPVLMLSGLVSDISPALKELANVALMAKPFGVTEFIAQVRALLRTGPPKVWIGQDVIECGELTIDVAKRWVVVRGRPVELTATEFDLLAELASHPGCVFTRSELLQRIWGGGDRDGEHAVNTHINRLRAKLERNTERPEWIHAGPTGGYAFAAASPPRVA
jgi:DNA-binding response OmpR family regulator